MSESSSFDHSVYLSPFTWRYGSDAMRRVWSLLNQRRLWRQVWVALAQAQAELGIVSAEAAADLAAHAEDVDLERARAIEAETHHDLVAELRTFAEQCPVGGGILHLGATSADIQDNADALRLGAALDLVVEELARLLETLAEAIERWADTICMGYTHIQPAEPTTVGYRLAQYAQDLLTDWEELRRVRAGLRGKGIKGAVGTGASYAELLRGSGHSVADLEGRVMARLGLAAFPVATQTYPRKQDWLVLNALAGLAGSLHKLMLDLRILQSPAIGEWAEPFREKQVGSSAMPFKRNPITAEKVDSLARWVAALPRVAWDNAALAVLERTLDDSANRRVMLAEAFLAVDEIVKASASVLGDLRLFPDVIARNLAVFGAFASVERVLMALVSAGADRQEMHERLRQHSLAAWAEMSRTGHNPLCELLGRDETIAWYIGAARIGELMEVSPHIGDAPQWAHRLAQLIRAQLEQRERDGGA
ncbi:MAG: adenylosuccinate lyase [Anaerolineae bacterium]|nr:adenylosuccinate lyase [Anaerolineae bacterium]